MAPQFWTRPAGALLRLIGPLAPGIRAPRPIPWTPPIPVLAVGSLSLGGTGKTPAVIALAQRYVMQGRAVHVVTTGPNAPLRIDERNHRVEEVGDEPLLIAAFAPTWSAADPRAGISAAAQSGAEVVVLDGGFPDMPVRAALTIAVEDARRGFGNGFAWPLGPLKRRLPALARADIVLTVGPPEAQEIFSQSWSEALTTPRLTAQLAPLATGMDWPGQAVVAFAGIGVPERFFATLRALGAEIVEARALVDHQELTPPLLARLEARARAAGAQLVTTEKDAVRLPAEFRMKVVSLPVRLELDDWPALEARLP